MTYSQNYFIWPICTTSATLDEAVACDRWKRATATLNIALRTRRQLSDFDVDGALCSSGAAQRRRLTFTVEYSNNWKRILQPASIHSAMMQQGDPYCHLSVQQRAAM